MGGNTLVQFRLLGFDIRLDTSWIFIAGLIVWTLGNGYYRGFTYVSPIFPWLLALVGAAGFFLSILLHELGHAVVARNYGIPIRGVTLLMFGGITEFAHAPKTPRQEFMISAAGPFVNFLLGLLCIGLGGLAKNLGMGDAVSETLRYLVFINFMLAIFNIIPAFPLDGGKILRAGLWKGLKDYGKATRIAAQVGIGFSFLLMAWGAWLLMNGQYIGGLWMFFIASMLFGSAKQAASQFKK